MVNGTNYFKIKAQLHLIQMLYDMSAFISCSPEFINAKDTDS